MIFKEKEIKKLTKKFAISKFLMRIFFANHKTYPSSDQVVEFNKNLEEQLESKKKGKYNMVCGISKIFGVESGREDSSLSRSNRMVMRAILNDHLKREVILNSFTEKNRLSYMIGCKVYALRTRSR